MSSAFVKEVDAVDELPDRPISEHPNYVTETGLARIEAALAHAQAEHTRAHEAADRDALAKAGRDLRYWTARRGSAQLVTFDASSGEIRFGATVTFKRDNGRKQVFRIVGEDEADPAQGTISHVSPLARALYGKGVGDEVRVGDADAEIVGVK